MVFPTGKMGSNEDITTHASKTIVEVEHFSFLGNKWRCSQHPNKGCYLSTPISYHSYTFFDNHNCINIITVVLTSTPT